MRSYSVAIGIRGLQRAATSGGFSTETHLLRSTNVLEAYCRAGVEGGASRSLAWRLEGAARATETAAQQRSRCSGRQAVFVGTGAPASRGKSAYMSSATLVPLSPIYRSSRAPLCLRTLSSGASGGRPTTTAPPADGGATSASSAAEERAPDGDMARKKYGQAVDDEARTKDQRRADREEEAEDVEYFAAPKDGAEAAGGGTMMERAFSMLGWGVMAAAAAFILSMYQIETEDVERLLAEYREKEKEDDAGAAVGFASAALAHYLSYRQYVHNFTDPRSEQLLPDLPPHLRGGTYTLVLDLDETIICSDWQRKRGWRTFKRPGVDDFIIRMGQMYELVVYTPTLFTYANPILDRLDPHGYIPPTHRLYRDANQMRHGQFIRDISKLNRDPKRVIYITADKSSTQMHPDNSIVIKQFKIDDADMGKSAADTVLLDLMPFLEAVVRQQAPDVRVVISSYDGKDIPETFRQRTKDLQTKMREKSASTKSTPLLKSFLGR